MKKRKLARGFQTRAFRAGGYSVMAAVLVIAIAVAVNMFASALPANLTQLDITSSQLFSISEQTELVAGGLETEVNIYWVVQSGQEDSTIDLLLQQYEGMSSYINVIKTDPDASPGFIAQYELDSVYNNSLLVESGERYRYVSYDSIYTYDYSSYYTTGSYDVSFAGEGVLTSAISYVVSEDLSKLYVLTGHGELSISSDFQTAIEQENIEVESLTLLTEEAVPEDADCVLIYGPERDISEEEEAMLEEYLAQGGNLIVLTDPSDEERPNLEALMAAYGMEAAEGMVLEGDYSYCALGTPYYLLPEIEYHTITSPLISDGYYVLLPLAQGLGSNGEERDTLSVSELLTTSEDAYSKLAGYGLTTYDREDGDLDGPFALAMIAEEEIGEDTQSHVIWISSTYLLDDQTNMQVSGGNQDFFLNCLGYVMEQESSVTIHAKSMSYDYLTMSSATASMLTVLFVGILPLGYLILGIQIWYRRKRR